MVQINILFAKIIGTNMILYNIKIIYFNFLDKLLREFEEP